MNLTNEILDQIGAYLCNQMSPAEREAFVARLALTPELRKEVSLQWEMKQGLQLIAEKQRFKQLHEELRQANQLAIKPTAKVVAFKPASKRWAYWAVAASLALVIGFGWYITQTNSTQLAEEQVADEFFSPAVKAAPVFPTDPDLLGASNTEQGQDSLQLAQALTLLKDPQIAAAINNLQAIASRGHNHWGASAQWYLALAYLKNHQREQGKKLLTNIATTKGHPYQIEATQVLQKLQ
ncbi:MAG: hypothetical protein QM669_07400 [Siphonobacter sp.]